LFFFTEQLPFVAHCKTLPFVKGHFIMVVALCWNLFSR